MRVVSSSIFFFAALILYGCSDAPRNNPLDPHSSQYIGTSIVSGQVILRDQNTPVAGATVASLQDNVSTSSDSNGYYSFDRLTAETQTLVCTKDNFVPDTQRVVLQSRAQQQVVFKMNGAPYVLSQEILTRKIDRYYPSPLYFVDIYASVTDPNGITDVDSVWFSVDTLLYPMVYSVSLKEFQTTILKYDLPTNTIEWLVDQPLRIRSKDRYNAVNYSTPFYVSRIIENTATPTYPISANNDTTNSTPLFKWSPPDVTFNFTYTITLSLIEADISTVVWTYTGLNSFYEELQFPSNSSGVTLTAGNYGWTVTVVDDFGNYSSSKEIFFVIK